MVSKVDASDMGDGSTATLTQRKVSLISIVHAVLCSCSMLCTVWFYAIRWLMLLSVHSLRKGGRSLVSRRSWQEVDWLN